jgi:hypothetical protein
MYALLDIVLRDVGLHLILMRLLLDLELFLCEKRLVFVLNSEEGCIALLLESFAELLTVLSKLFFICQTFLFQVSLLVVHDLVVLLLKALVLVVDFEEGVVLHFFPRHFQFYFVF